MNSLKERYLETIENPTVIYYMSQLFRQVEREEILLNKDVCEFTKEEILSYLEKLQSRSLESLVARRARMNVYTKWCAEKGYTNAKNEWDIVGRSDLLSILRQNDENTDKYIDRKEIENLAEELLNPCDQYMLLSVYEGLTGNGYAEYLNIAADEIDLDNKTIHGLLVSRKLLQYASESAAQEMYISLSQKVERKQKLRQDGMIFRTADNGREGYNGTDEAAIRKKFGAKWRKMITFLGLKGYTIADVSYSGMITELMKYQKPNMPNILDSEECREIEKRYGAENINKYYLKQKIDRYFRITSGNPR